jgi:hypothetical protein
LREGIPTRARIRRRDAARAGGGELVGQRRTGGGRGEACARGWWPKAEGTAAHEWNGGDAE